MHKTHEAHALKGDNRNDRHKAQLRAARACQPARQCWGVGYKGGVGGGGEAESSITNTLVSPAAAAAPGGEVTAVGCKGLVPVESADGIGSSKALLGRKGAAEAAAAEGAAATEWAEMVASASMVAQSPHPAAQPQTPFTSLFTARFTYLFLYFQHVDVVDTSSLLATDLPSPDLCTPRAAQDPRLRHTHFSLSPAIARDVCEVSTPGRRADARSGGRLRRHQAGVFRIVAPPTP